MQGKRGLTLEEHQTVGQELSQVFATLGELSELIADNYGQRGHTGYHGGHQLQKAKTALLLVRQTLIAAMETEYPYCHDNYYKLTRL
jgi:hypothetical protein